MTPATSNQEDPVGKQERTLKAREREKEALSLRRAGASYQEVADQLGYGNPANARRAVCRGGLRRVRTYLPVGHRCDDRNHRLWGPPRDETR